MHKYKYSIGIDVSKKRLDFCVLSGVSKVTAGYVSNDKKGLRAMQKELNALGISCQASLFCCESSGIYHHTLASWTTQNGYPIWIEHPIAIKN